jgi:hypothetical protein
MLSASDSLHRRWSTQAPLHMMPYEKRNIKRSCSFGRRFFSAMDKNAGENGKKAVYYV